jgi:hypothetical protein
VGKVEFTRPRNPSGTDTITMENLDVPGCQDQQVAQYDTNGIPSGMPVSVGGSLGQAEPDMPGFTGKSLGGGLSSFIGGKEKSANEKTKRSFSNMGLYTDLAKAGNAGNQQAEAAKNTLNQAGVDSQDAKDKSARDTAKSDQDNGWIKTLGDSIQKGFEDGAKSAATVFGSAAADKTAGTVFRGPKKSDSAKDGGEGKSSSGEGEQVASGSKSSSSCSGGGQGSGQGSVVPPPAGQSNPPPTSADGKGESVKGITMTCQFCGYTETLPPGVQPDPGSHCPKCGCGADKGVVMCSYCGYRWLVDANAGPPSSCPKCGKGGKATPEDGGVGNGAAGGVEVPIRSNSVASGRNADQ